MLNPVIMIEPREEKEHHSLLIELCIHVERFPRISVNSIFTRLFHRVFHRVTIGSSPERYIRALGGSSEFDSTTWCTGRNKWVERSPRRNEILRSY